MATIYCAGCCIHNVSLVGQDYAAECSKSMKSVDHQLSRIQALFLDAAGPLSGLLDSIDQGTEVTLDDVESAVKAALTFLGNVSS